MDLGVTGTLRARAITMALEKMIAMASGGGELMIFSPAAVKLICIFPLSLLAGRLEWCQWEDLHGLRCCGDAKGGEDRHGPGVEVGLHG